MQLKKLLEKPIQRQLVAVFLAKGIGLEEKANDKDIIKLPYKDSKLVDEDKVKYVDVLLDAKVLSPDGNGEGKFQPEDSLKR